MDLRADLQAALGAAYTVQRELGGGGMSHLFVATDHVLGRDVVVKVVAAGSGARLSIERFRREVALAASLQHPHIVAVLAAGEVAGLPYFLMPYVEGQSLRQQIEAGPLAVRDAVAILRDVARALTYAHERGVVHRDIKPDNVLLAGGSAMLNDFGIAKALATARERTPGGTLTQEGYALGTPGYMAPEQVAGDPSVDHRADIYAFGVLAYEMLTGKTPFHEKTPHQLLAAQLTESSPPITMLRGDIPAKLGELVMRCLERHPTDRPESARAIVEALDDPAIISGPVMLTTALMPGAVRRRRWVAGVLGAFVVVAVAAGAWVLKGTAAADVPARSVAVLPLDNVGNDSATAYFAAGFTDEITLALSRLPGVRVASPTAAASFRGRAVPPAEIGDALGVATLLEGSVQVSAGRLRLVARLTDARGGQMLWSQRFEADVRNLFAVQDSIAAAIAEALRSRFGGVAAPPTAAARGAQGTSDVAAYDAFLRGRFLFQRRTPASLRDAIAAFEQAVEQDPGFARAYAGLADVYAVLPLYTVANADSAQALALGAVEMALALDSTLADALASRGYQRMLLWRWGEAERDLRAATRADSLNVNAWQWYGEWLLYNGRGADAVRALARANQLDPASAVLTALHALALGTTGRTAEALPVHARAIELDSLSPVPRFMLGATLLNGGRAAEAIAPFELARRLGADGPVVRGLLGAALARAGQGARASALRDSILARAGAAGATAAIAQINLGLGDTAQALTWLEWAVGAHDALFASQSLLAPLYDSIRGSARFRGVLGRVGLDAARVAP